MSGHSKWSTIKRQKEAKDAARGKLFSQLSKAISIAVKTGGGASPDSNFKLRIAIDNARQANMPKENIERAISRASSSSQSLEEMQYEGFGPAGIAVLVEAATDNRNRTAQELKNIFESHGGSLAGPGAVSYRFEPKGSLFIAKEPDSEAQILKLIDLGVGEIEEQPDGLELYVDPKHLLEFKLTLQKNGFRVLKSELVQKPTDLVLTSSSKAQQAISLLDALENHEDVQSLSTNLDLSEK